MGLLSRAARRIRAFHGSPHDFDRFDSTRIGTGEGAQAYGHGLYFAEAEGVGRSYSRLAARDGVRDADFYARQLIDNHGGDRVQALRVAEENARRHPGDTDYQAILDRLRDPAFRETHGRLYEVSLPGGPYLDWDRPLSEQPAQIRNVVGGDLWGESLQPIEKTRGDGLYRALMHDVRGEAIDAGDVANTTMGSAQARASQRLREAGIIGIRYLDQGSRAAGEGTRNYVIFDPSVIEILRKYGIAGMIGGGGLLSAMDRQEAAA